MQKFVRMDGVEMVFNIRRDDFSKYVKVDADIAKTLVMFDPVTKTVTVDNSADPQYALWAGIHECICCLDEFNSIAPAVEDPKDQCGAIDQKLLSRMPRDLRELYRENRIKMFESLIKYHLNPALEEQFAHSLAILKDDCH